MFGFLAASWRRSQSRCGESSGLDRLGVGWCLECQSNPATADTFSWPSLRPRPCARGSSWTCTCTCCCSVVLIGGISQLTQQSLVSFCARREVFAKFACKLGWIEEWTRLARASIHTVVSLFSSASFSTWVITTFTQDAGCKL